ncbi:uncharacterized protein BDR25DRAFT_381574 [Lindgomyces ingoldianus]|uniref:Uncharacterized protein n=1 Tax=Lindgomyces ingoldianus TaxID=673940 RepID=A0ACB6QC21_9PLEO|nr:uncharacterized protein BDR25DRAFT_381574 [Lindgomyces ingoldianus]KAF2464153.1 hypothetical protein BDR25DRAFT_381574 [Lindgomyces ingoldianus]
MSPRRGVPGILFPDRGPNQICRLGQGSQSDMSPRRGVPGILFPDRGPNQICRLGQGSQSDMSPRRGVPGILFLDRGPNEILSFRIRIACLRFFRTFYLSPRTIGYVWGCILSFVLDLLCNDAGKTEDYPTRGRSGIRGTGINVLELDLELGVMWSRVMRSGAGRGGFGSWGCNE